MTSTILRNATVLSHNPDESVSPLRNIDILITGNKISKIGPDVAAPANAEVIDCTGKIVSPGFIDTHHHLWQTQLKGRHEDESLWEYMYNGNIQSYNFTPEDIFWGQLTGCLEALDAGTTFVLDHSHAIVTADHGTQALSATAASGLRALFAHSTTNRLSSWTRDECVFSQDLLPEWALSQLEDFARKQPYGDGRVTIGLGFDLFFLPKEVVVGVFERAKKAGVRGVTCHVQKNPLFSYNSTTDLMQSYNLLSRPPPIVFSHCNGLSPTELATLSSASVYASSTPDTECQMGMGWPVGLWPGVKSSLGVDCHVNNSSSILAMGRALLQMARQETGSELLKEKKFPANLRGSTTQVFNLATIEGAKAVGMEGQIGRIAEGYLADLVIFDATTPAMAPVGETDPLIAVLRHSDVRDIECVIVDGKVRKRNGKLIDVEVPGKGRMSWSHIAKELLRSRGEVWKRIEGCNIEKAAEAMAKIFMIDSTKLVKVD